MSRSPAAGLLVFALSFVAFELSVNGVWATDHATSLVQLDYALWHDHSFALTSASRVPPWSVDDFAYAGQNYSAIAPGAAFLALPFTGVGFSIAGGYTAHGPVLILSETFVALTGALAACLVYSLGLLYFRRSTSVFLGLAFAFSTIAWPMATYFFQSDPSALFVVLGAYLAIRAVRKEGSALTFAFLSGIAAGVAFTVDYVNGVLLPIAFVFLLLGKRGSKAPWARTTAAFWAGTLPGLGAIGYYDYSIFGSPFIGTEQSYLHATSVLGSFTTSPVTGLMLDLVSFSRGLLVFAPFLVLGVMGYVDALRKESVRLEMLLLLAVFLGILLPYSMWYGPTGGLSYGPRFLVAAIPFLLLPAGFFIEQAVGLRVWLVKGTYLAGVVMNGMAAVVSDIPAWKGFSVSPFVSDILPNFLSGHLDTWWGSGSPYALPLAVLLIAALGATAPLVAVEVLRRQEIRERLGAAPLTKN